MLSVTPANHFYLQDSDNSGNSERVYAGEPGIIVRV